MKLKLVDRVKVGKAYHYYLSDVARQFTPEQLDFICSIPELNQYKIPYNSIPDLIKKLKAISNENYSLPIELLNSAEKLRIGI